MPDRVRHDGLGQTVRINNWQAVLLSVVLGAIAACGFAPLEMVSVALLAFAAWIALVHAAPTMRQSLLRGYAFGVGHFTVNNNWFQHAFDFQDAMPPVLGYFAAVALALYLAVYPAMAAGIAWRFRRGRIDAAFVLIFAATWIATEYLRAVLFTGYAWDSLGVLWVPVQPIAWFATLVGTYALSGLTIAGAGALLLLYRRTPARMVGVAAVLLAIALAPLVSYRQDATMASPDAPRVRVVQPNIGNEERENASEGSLQALIRGSSRPGAAPRLIVWPEGLIQDMLESGYPPYVYDRSPSLLRERIAAVLGPRDLLMTNAPRLSFDGEGRITGAANSVLAIGPDARIRGVYDKAHLVPYGEYLPMPWLLKPLGLARLVPGSLDFAPGPGPATIASAFGPIGIQVCYEIVFSGEVVDRSNRPRLLFNPSNDAWFGRWGPPQHLAQARMRAIEEGLPIVRATPTGISAVIAADGTLLATVPHEVAGAIEVPMPPPGAPTLFSRIGNLMAALVAVALFATAVVLRRRRR